METLNFTYVIEGRKIWKLLLPTTPEELIYGKENDLLTCNDKTQVRHMVIMHPDHEWFTLS
jgi:hypothetical protein